jgi:hypothetical protein
VTVIVRTGKSPRQPSPRLFPLPDLHGLPSGVADVADVTSDRLFRVREAAVMLV